MKHLEAVVNQIGVDIVEAYKTELPGSRISDTISFNITTSDYIIKLEVELNDYYKFIEHGRRPGSLQPPKRAMIDFIDRKGIPLKDGITKESLAFLIGRAIARDGIEARPILATATQDIEYLIKEAFKKDMLIYKSELLNLWQI